MLRDVRPDSRSLILESRNTFLVTCKMLLLLLYVLSVPFYCYFPTSAPQSSTVHEDPPPATPHTDTPPCIAHVNPHSSTTHADPPSSAHRRRHALVFARSLFGRFAQRFLDSQPNTSEPSELQQRLAQRIVSDDAPSVEVPDGRNNQVCLFGDC